MPFPSATSSPRFNASRLLIVSLVTMMVLLSGAPRADAASGPYGPFTTPEELVRQTYQDFLLRQPTATELQVGAAALSGGQTPAQFVVAVTETGEAFRNVRSVVRLYRTYYLRNPDNGGLRFWISQRQQGVSLGHVSNQFAAAPEFALRYGTLDDGGFVDLVYKNVLNRKPDASGRAYWIDMLAKGLYRGQLMTRFSEAPEYLQKSNGYVTAVHLYNSLFQLSLSRGLSDSYGPAINSGSLTAEELATQLMADNRYRSRFN